MANHKSSVKRIRQTVKRNTINRSRRSKVQTLAKAVDVAIVGKDVEAAKTALRAAEAGLATAAGQGVIHKRTAARKTSRLAKRVKKVALGA